MKTKEPKAIPRLPADEFDRMMRHALGAAPTPAEKQAKSPRKEKSKTSGEKD